MAKARFPKAARGKAQTTNHDHKKKHTKKHKNIKTTQTTNHDHKKAQTNQKLPITTTKKHKKHKKHKLRITTAKKHKNTHTHTKKKRTTNHDHKKAKNRKNNTNYQSRPQKTQYLEFWRTIFFDPSELCFLGANRAVLNMKKPLRRPRQPRRPDAAQPARSL